MTYLYPALCDAEKRELVLGRDPDEIAFGNPAEGIGIIVFKSEDLFQEIWNWFVSLGLREDYVEAIDIGKFLSALNKSKGDTTPISTERGADGLLYIKGETKPCSKPVYSIFTLMRFQSEADVYKEAYSPTFSGYTHALPLTEPATNVEKHHIPREDFRDTALGNVFTSDIRMVCVKGIDQLVVSHFDTPPLFYGFRFWSCGGSAIRYACMIETEDMIFISSRSNVFFIPIPQD